MLKVFISQPMQDRTSEEIMTERYNAIEIVKAKYGDEAEIIDSYFADFEESKYKTVPLGYLAKSIELLATADVAVFCEGWDYARGCRIEYSCASEYGLAVVLLKEAIEGV